MSDALEFEYKGRNIKVTARKTARGKYLGVPEIDGIDLSGKEIGKEQDTIDGALDEGERKAKEIVDADG